MCDAQMQTEHVRGACAEMALATSNKLRFGSEPNLTSDLEHARQDSDEASCQSSLYGMQQRTITHDSTSGNCQNGVLGNVRQ